MIADSVVQLALADVSVMSRNWLVASAPVTVNFAVPTDASAFANTRYRVPAFSPANVWLMPSFDASATIRIDFPFPCEALGVAWAQVVGVLTASIRRGPPWTRSS